MQRYTLPSYFVFITIIIVALLLFSSCQNKPKPLPIEKMSKVLTEMHVAEAYAQVLPKDSNSTDLKNKDSLKKYISSIFAENNITEVEFKQSIDWYKSRPELLDSVYQQVLANITIWQSKIGRK